VPSFFLRGSHFGSKAANQLVLVLKVATLVTRQIESPTMIAGLRSRITLVRVLTQPTDILPQAGAVTIRVM